MDDGRVTKEDACTDVLRVLLKTRTNDGFVTSHASTITIAATDSGAGCFVNLVKTTIGFQICLSRAMQLCVKNALTSSFNAAGTLHEVMADLSVYVQMSKNLSGSPGGSELQN